MVRHFFPAPIDKCVPDGHGPVMTRTTLSPRQAATRAGCGRSSIMRALASGHLRATRGNEGSWLITPDALDDWLSLRTEARTSPDQTEDQPPGTSADREASPLVDAEKRAGEAEARAAAAEARADALADQVADLRTERSRLLSIIEGQSSRLSEVRPGIIARLFGLRH